MAVSDVLDELRKTFPACEMIAFADLSADMILASSSAKAIPQERWDGFCGMANDVLRGDYSAKISACLGDGSGNTLARAALIGSSECDVFLAASQAPEYVFCVVGRTDLDIERFYLAAQPVLDQLVQDG